VVRSLVGEPPAAQHILMAGLQLDTAAQENARFSRRPMDLRHDGGAAL
jgi:hypothetical protein